MTGFSVTGIGYAGAALGQAMSMPIPADLDRESFMQHVVTSLQGLDLMRGGESARGQGLESVTAQAVIAPTLGFTSNGRSGNAR